MDAEAREKNIEEETKDEQQQQQQLEERPNEGGTEGVDVNKTLYDAEEFLTNFSGLRLENDQLKRNNDELQSQLAKAQQDLQQLLIDKDNLEANLQQEREEHKEELWKIRGEIQKVQEERLQWKEKYLNIYMKINDNESSSTKSRKRKSGLPSDSEEFFTNLSSTYGLTNQDEHPVAVVLLKRKGDDVLGGFFDANLVPIQSLSNKKKAGSQVDNSNDTIARESITEAVSKKTSTKEHSATRTTSTTENYTKRLEVVKIPESTPKQKNDRLDFPTISIPMIRMDDNTALSVATPNSTNTLTTSPSILRETSMVVTANSCRPRGNIPTVGPVKLITNKELKQKYTATHSPIRITSKRSSGSGSSLLRAANKNSRKILISNNIRINENTVDITKHMESKQIGDGTFVYSCRICSREDSRQYVIATHVRTHFDVRPFVCNLCGKGFKVKRYLREHIKGRHENSRHRCIHCGVMFRWRAALYNHNDECQMNPSVIAKAAAAETEMETAPSVSVVVVEETQTKSEQPTVE